MIVNFLINIILDFLAALFSWLPDVERLPEIVGFDIDAAIVTGVGQLQTFFATFWPIQIMFNGFLFIMGYYIVKMTLQFFLGHRAPQ